MSRSVTPPAADPAPDSAAVARADDIRRRLLGDAQLGIDELLRDLRGERAEPDGTDVDELRARWREGGEALVDPDTGAATPALLRDRLGHALARYFRGGTRFALLYIGHTERDHAAVARGVTASLRGTDTAATMGDGELAVLLDTLAAEDDAAAVAARLRLELMRRHPGIAVCMGVSHLAPLGTDPDAVLTRAYAALCRARRAGAGRIEVAPHRD